MLRSKVSSGGLLHLAPAAVAMQRVGAFAGLPMLLTQVGTDAESVVASAGLAPGALDNPGNHVPYTALCRLLSEGAARTSCAHFGLLAGRMWHLSDLGALGELTAHSGTVGEALQSLATYQHLHSTGGLVFVLERGGVVDFGYAIYHTGVAAGDQFYDSILAAAFNFMRELAGPGWLPADVFIPHARPRDIGPYRRLLKVQPRFDAEFCAIRFAASWLSRPVAGSEPVRRREALAQLEAAGEGEFVDQVIRAVRTVLLQGKHSGDDVAQMLSMHRRTLNRRLQARGTTFQQVLDKVRFDVARQLLGESDIPLDDVAATLGYAGVSPFMRTFRRWARTTPGQWRRAAAVARLARDAFPSPEYDARFGEGTEGPRAA